MQNEGFMSVSNIVLLRASAPNLETSIALPQNDPTLSKIEEKTKPIFRVLAFLAGLAIAAAGIAFIAFAISSASPLILLIPIVFTLSLSSLPLFGFAVLGDPCTTSSPSTEGDHRSDMIDMRPGYLYH